MICNIQEKSGIPTSWILLDSQSTVDAFSDGKMLATLKVKPQCVLLNMSNLPLTTLERHGSVTLAIEVMAINKTPFVITTSCDIHFGMVGWGNSREKMSNKIMTSIRQVI